MPGRMSVLVTDAARSIGRATAQVLIEGGHEVVTTARDASLVNNAGVSGSGPLEDFPLADFQRVFEVNTLGPLRLPRQ
jgi:NAD(P)-dependent dehydrogenase (short-subunit alcohol dehydrogenase family)